MKEREELSRSDRIEPGSCATQDEYGVLMDTLRVSVSKHKIDDGFTLVWANSYFYEMLGTTPEEYATVYRNSPVCFYENDPQFLAILNERVVDALENGRGGYTCTTGVHTTAGELKWIKLASTFIDEYVDGYQVSYTTMTDVTDLVEARNALEKANAELERMAFVDPVTEGFNQTKFDLVARRVIDAAPAGSYALVALDLKKFKLLNEIQGTKSGDMVLRYVHECLSDHLSGEECVGRINADAFNLLMRVERPEVMLGRIDGMVQDINRFNVESTRPYYLSFTVGVYPIDDRRLPMTIVRDRANFARNAGKDASNARHFTCMFYSDVDRQNLLSEQDMENRMHGALERGEFVAYFQPKQLLVEGAIGGAEALVRWIDPVRGLVPPDEFVPFFERNGFIINVDLCVFDQVCALLSSWIDQGRKPVPISVNMSRAHLRERDFVTPYERIRKRYGVPASLIEFELTETLVFGDPETFMGVIDLLHACGYRCSLDDFGSGYSSLNVLKDVDIDTMKLDRAFFSAGDAAGEREWDVVESVVGLAKKLDMKTVAEGVEELGQASRLRAMQCDMLQGYVFSRPLPVNEFEKLLFGE